MTASDPLAEWLHLREATDHRARSSEVFDAVAASFPAADPIRLLDLGTGTGSNVRYLIPRLPGRQQWTVVDRSPALLAVLLTRTAAWANDRGLQTAALADGCLITGEGLECRIDVRVRELGAVDATDLFEGRHLVMASALLDLVSESWLHDVAAQCRAAGASVLFPLNYDGRSHCTPEEPEDEQVRALFNRHQVRDKGLGGPAAGPAATDAAARAFQAVGFQVHTAQSDWTIAPDAHAFQRQLIDGWAEASTEVAPDQAETIAAWRRRRLDHVAQGASHLTVGHHDLAAWMARA